jgi:hypothetical protein
MRARRELDYEWNYHNPQLLNLHFRRGKLWFNDLGRVYGRPGDANANNVELQLCISYFDLNEQVPKKVVVGQITEVSTYFCTFSSNSRTT